MYLEGRRHIEEPRKINEVIEVKIHFSFYVLFLPKMDSPSVGHGVVGIRRKVVSSVKAVASQTFCAEDGFQVTWLVRYRVVTWKDSIDFPNG